MKILELRFKNLNSLYSEWCIDFTDPEYLSNGIFALTGPTGAGKSTVLDAICLALYGATPRLGKITKSGNEIMSRQTGECYAEVVFESQAGRFLSHWQQRRSRKKADGILQMPEHEIVNADTGKPIETKKSLVPHVIETKTGMDFERFTRSMLLAQGGFDTFLKADAEQKSRILEQITGTEIYTAISRRVHEWQRDARGKLSLLQAETAGIVLLEPEQEKRMALDLEGKLNQETALAVQTTETGKAIAWLTGIEGLKNEIHALTAEAEKLQSEIEAFKPDRERLRRALKATELDGNYATLIAVRQQQAIDQASLKAEADKLPEIEKNAQQHAQALKSAEAQTLKAKEHLKQTAPLIQKVRSLDQKLAEHKRAIAAFDTSCKREAANIESTRQLKTQEAEKRREAANQLKIAEQYLEDHSQDEWLVSGLAGIEEQVNTLSAGQKEILQLATLEEKSRATLQQAIQKQTNATRRVAARKKELEETVKSLEQEKKALSAVLGNRLLREYRTEKESLLREMAFLTKITELEAYRAKLEDGKPCPLCGAEEHPFAGNNVPVADETEKKIEALSERIQKAENQEGAIKKRETAANVARQNLTESEKHEVAGANEKMMAEKSLFDLRKHLDNARTGFQESKQAVLAKLHPLGIEEILDEDISFLLESLRTRLARWQKQSQKKAAIAKQISELDSELKRLDAVIETQNRSLADKRKALESVKNEFAEGTAQRREWFGNQIPDDEEHLLNQALADAEQTEKEARIRNNTVQQKLTSTKANVASLQERIIQRNTELKHLAEEFIAVLHPTGFSDEKEFLEARLSPEAREGLREKAKALDHKETDLTARHKDREKRLAAEMAKKITDASLDHLKPQFKALEEHLQQLKETISGLKYRLNENRAAQARMKEKQAAIKAQKKECQRWQKLHALIGSADGKKYRNFAQGLTFELMVSHANRKLEKMTDRYLLIRDDVQPLELNVVDNYQAGEIRSTKNLSGGESFIVSLTLALGLSTMSSRKVRVDSLFLDEGFGTLDEEALDTALETLSRLQQDGKLIGIISHVSALRERISTQITVTPVSSGKSTLSGPGCHVVSQ